MCMLTLATFVSAETYTYTLTNGDLSPNGGTATLGGYNWSTPEANISWDAMLGNGYQLGSKGSPLTSFSISSSDFSEFKINSITVKSCAGGSKSDATMTIKVGDKSSDAYALTSTMTEYKFDCNGAQGDINISWEQKTSLAMFLHTITVDYTIPAELVDVPAPGFSIIGGHYADQIKVTVETTDQTAKLYYTLDGTTPSYDDYKAGVGSTKRGSYYIMERTITETTTLKVIAVIEDGDIAYSSDIAEATYIIHPGIAYIPITEIVSGSRYAFIATDVIANPIEEDVESDYLNVTGTTTVNDSYIKDIERNSFTFTAVTGGYTIQDCFGRYLYIKGTEPAFHTSTTQPTENAVWSISIDDNGAATITSANGNKVYYSAQDGVFGCYAATEIKEDMVLPVLYTKRDIPTITITPAENSTLDEFQTITISCATGLKPGDNFKAVATDGMPVSHGGWSYDMTLKQVDDNTITLSTSEPITGNKNFWVQFTGSLYMDPEVMNVAVKFPTFGISYTVKEAVPTATIDNVTPANNSIVGSLSYILFTFSYYAGETEDETITPKLYKEGDSENLFAVEYTTDTEDGTGKVAMMDGALKVTEPITVNGTYILEIPDGYFIDGYGNNIKGMTLKYTVQNDGTGIEDIVTESNNGWIVYNVLGVKVMETTDATELSTLAKGIYIINGVKTIIK